MRIARNDFRKVGGSRQKIDKSRAGLQAKQDINT